MRNARDNLGFAHAGRRLVLSNARPRLPASSPACCCTASTTTAQTRPATLRRSPPTPACTPRPPRATAGEIARLGKAGAKLDARDAHGRTPLMVAAFRRDVTTARALIAAGADLNCARDAKGYDVITIAAVLDDLEMLKLAIASGGNARAITSPYKGTGADRRSAPGPRRGRRRPDCRQGPARPCQQPGLDRADRGHRAGRRRPAPLGDRARRWSRAAPTSIWLPTGRAFASVAGRQPRTTAGSPRCSTQSRRQDLAAQP